MKPRKLTKEDIDKVRHIEGFPIGKDEDIIALSNAPYYTACPNPFIEDFIEEYGKPYDEETDDYHREPFAADVGEDKHDLIYNIHSYHTKVPPKAIKKYIEHYTNPGDLVLDVFSGTGMTGVAAQICDDNGVGKSHRVPILIDISTIASHISSNYNTPILSEEINDLECIIQDLRNQFNQYYETNHVVDGNQVLTFTETVQRGNINYVVWADVFICPNCSYEFNYYDVAVDKKTNKTMKEFNCPECSLLLAKSKCTRATELTFDQKINQSLSITKSVPVLINYSVGKSRFNKTPDKHDLDLIKELKNIPSGLPNEKVAFELGDKTTEMFRGNVNYIFQVYRTRTLHVLNEYYKKGCGKSKALFLLTSALPKLTILNRFMPEHGSRALVGPMAGTFYLPAMSVENNVINQLEFQLKKLKNLNYKSGPSIVSQQSATSLVNIPEHSIDYIFVDPPFGANIMYSELNSISESWLKTKTNAESEAIMNKTQRKEISEYFFLMQNAFSELYRVLKPNRWMTVEFHNSKNSVWNTIQSSLSIAGFIVADVRILNKEKKTINQYNTRGAVDQDLIISAYKPKDSFKREFTNKAGSVETVWTFTHQHLENLPAVVLKSGTIEIVSERQPFLLFDRMIAYHIMSNIAVPIDATDFYRGLDERYLTRDGMYFLHDQVNEYDVARITNDIEPIQFELFVTNEKSAIAWLYQQLDNPQTYAELQPKFMQEIKAWDKFEERPELNTLLEENFLQNDDGKWYVPDVTKSADVIRLREKKLYKEFEGYLASKGKLKLFRTEAVRVGFAKLWTDKNYKMIVVTADRLPESVIQEDDKLLMYYDISLGRI